MYNKILIIQTAFLGDVVLTIPLIMAVHKKYPASYIAVLAIPTTKEILENNPAINEIIIFDKKGKDKGFVAFWQLVKKIKKHQFDLAILPHRSFKSALLAYLAGIPKRVGFKTSQGKMFLTDKVIYRRGVHEIERNLDLARKVDASTGEIDLSIYLTPQDINFATDIFDQYGIKAHDLVIGFNPGSVWPTKRWPAEKFAALGDKLVDELSAKIIIFGSKQDEEVAGEICRTMSSEPINLTGKTNLKQLAAIVKRCNVFVTNDSGAMHIAVSQNVPVVSIFGPTTRDIGFYPSGKNDIVVETDLPCRPCGKHGGYKCKKGTLACMKLITVQEVFDAVKKILSLN